MQCVGEEGSAQITSLDGKVKADAAGVAWSRDDRLEVEAAEANSMFVIPLCRR